MGGTDHRDPLNALVCRNPSQESLQHAESQSYQYGGTARRQRQKRYSREDVGTARDIGMDGHGEDEVGLVPKMHANHRVSNSSTNECISS